MYSPYINSSTGAQNFTVSFWDTHSWIKQIVPLECWRFPFSRANCAIIARFIETNIVCHYIQTQIGFSGSFSYVDGCVIGISYKIFGEAIRMLSFFRWSRLARTLIGSQSNPTNSIFTFDFYHLYFLLQSIDSVRSNDLTQLFKQLKWIRQPLAMKLRFKIQFAN